MLTIDKQNQNQSGCQKEFIVSDSAVDCNRLMLYTTIRVYGDEILKDSDCSLTMPLRSGEFEGNQPWNIRFWYEQSEVPGFRYQISGSERIFEAIGRRDRSLYGN